MDLNNRKMKNHPPSTGKKEITVKYIKYKEAFNLKYKICLISKVIVSKHLEYETSCWLTELLLVTYFYVKHIINTYEQYYEYEYMKYRCG